MNTLVDVNIKLGHWPFRRVKGIPALLGDLDKFNIKCGFVSSLSAVHYFNPQDGNLELVDSLSNFMDRFIPLAVIAPNLRGWEKDFEHCVREMGMRGVVLYPNYHQFSLSGPAADELAMASIENKLPVFIQTGLEDPRRQFRRHIMTEVPPEEIGTFAARHPGLTVIALGLKFGQPERLGTVLPRNLYFDISNYEKTGELEYAVEKFGVEKLLFGTNFPLFNIAANVLKLLRADISSEQKQLIASGNAQRLFSL